MNDWLARLRGFAERHPDDPDAAWLCAAVVARFRGEAATLDQALGNRRGFSPRLASALARRDVFMRWIARYHHAGVSDHAVAQVIALDLLIFQRRVWPRLKARGLMPPFIPEFQDRHGLLWALVEDGHAGIAPRTIRAILAKKMALPLANGPDAACEDAA